MENNNYTGLINKLADDLKSKGALKTSRVEDAFRSVGRHLFVADVPLDQIYLDKSIYTKRIKGVAVSSSTTPSFMSKWLELLQLEPGHKVLEIGAGTGYNAALMAHIVGETGHVVTIDVDKHFYEMSLANLSNAGFGNVDVICADGGYGYPSKGPYDRIILSVGGFDIAPAWIEQLKPGGTLVMGLNLNGLDRLVSFSRTEYGLESTDLEASNYTKLQGDFAGSSKIKQIGPQPELFLTADEDPSLDNQSIYDLLVGDHKCLDTDVQVTGWDLVGGLGSWLNIHEPTFSSLAAIGSMIERGIVPLLFANSKIAYAPPFVSTQVLISKTSLIGLSCPPESKSPFIEMSDDDSFDVKANLFVKQYGQDDALSEKVIDLIIAWEQSGRPQLDSMQIRVYPKSVRIDPQEDEFVFEKPWTNWIIKWDQA